MSKTNTNHTTMTTPYTYEDVVRLLGEIETAWSDLTDHEQQKVLKDIDELEEELQSLY